MVAKSISHHLRNPAMIALNICRGFSKWCEMDFVQPQYGRRAFSFRNGTPGRMAVFLLASQFHNHKKEVPSKRTHSQVDQHNLC